MEILTSITHEEANAIYQKQSITQRDRFKLDSFTHRTLSDEYDDLNNSEVQEIHRLEIQNLKRLLNSVAIVSGIYKDAQKTLLADNFVTQMIKVYDEEGYDEEMRNRLMFSTLLSYLMAELDYHKLKNPIFVGKVPQKIFKFRQLTAETWWASFVDQFCRIISFIYAKLGAEAAIGYAFSNIAYYLNKSQPYKFYPKSSDMNNAIYNICEKYLGEMFGDSSMLKKDNIIFYQDL